MNTGTYAHHLQGNCHCGMCHDPAPATGISPRTSDKGSHTGDRRGPIVATYDYRDAAGVLLYQVLRYAPKNFCQRRPDPTRPGHWIANLDGVRPVRYRLPELLTAEQTVPVFYNEGEKDTDNVRALALVGTTNAQGAGKLTPDAAEALRGRRIVILADNDQAGWEGAEKVAALLYSIAAEVRVLHLPGLPPKGDVSDWLAAGGTREQLLALASSAPPWEAPIVAPFPTHVLPGVAGDLVREGAAAMDIAPDFIGVPLLAFAAGTIGKRYCLEIKPGYRQWAVLYAATIGPPGCGKTPGVDLARAALDRRQKEAWVAYQRTLIRYEAEKRAYDALPRQERGDRVPPAEPVLEKFYTSDATMEALGRILSHCPGLTLYRDEFVGWVKSCDQYRGGKGNDRQKWLEGWSKTPWTIDRKAGPPLYIPDPCVSVCGGTQPDVLKELRHEAGARDGFIERLLLSYPVEHFPDDSDAEVDARTLEGVYRLFVALRPDDTPVDESIAIGISGEARALWKAWHRENTALLREATGYLQGIYAKLPNQLARLALVLHCLTYPDDPAAYRISRLTMRDAIELVEYFRAHARRVLPLIGQAAPAGRDNLVGKVAAILERSNGTWVFRSAIRDALHRNPSSEEIGSALAQLETQGLAERGMIRTSAGAGRPAEAWRSTVFPRPSDAETRERGNPPLPCPTAPNNPALPGTRESPTARGNPSIGDEEVMEWSG